MNDHMFELVRKIKDDDEEAIEEFVSTFTPKIINKTKNLKHHDKEDLKQELTIEITKALKRFNTDKAPELDDYIKKLKR